LQNVNALDVIALVCITHLQDNELIGVSWSHAEQTARGRACSQQEVSLGPAWTS